MPPDGPLAAGDTDEEEEAERETRHCITFTQAMFALFKALVGPGLLFLPAGGPFEPKKRRKKF